MDIVTIWILVILLFLALGLWNLNRASRMLDEETESFLEIDESIKEGGK